MTRLLMISLLFVSCSLPVFEGTIIGHEKNVKPSNLACSVETFTIVKWDDGTVGHLCGWKGNIGERVTVKS